MVFFFKLIKKFRICYCGKIILFFEDLYKNYYGINFFKIYKGEKKLI